MTLDKVLMRRAWLVSALLLSAAPAWAESPEPPEGPSTHRLRVATGFGHWFGSTVGFPHGISTPTVGVGVRPGLSFMEVRAQYTFSTKSLRLPSGAESHVGFALLELVASREMRVGNQRLNAYAGLDGVLVHARDVGYGFGMVIGAEYLFGTKLGAQNTFGVFMNAREVFYRLPGERTKLTDPEAQIDLGAVMTLF